MQYIAQILLMKQQFAVTHNFAGDRKEHDRSSINQHWSMWCSYGNIKRSKLFVYTTFWQKTFLYLSCLVRRESQSDELCSLRHIVLPWTLFCAYSNMFRPSHAIIWERTQVYLKPNGYYTIMYHNDSGAIFVQCI